tara:strand:- start:664 stop:870 length:207 start_codon:yes stop_codon:yes gene_type:complete
MQLEINEEIVDHIIKTELRESINDAEWMIKNLKKNKSRAPYEDADLKHSEEILLHLEAVYDYFGGNIK